MKKSIRKDVTCDNCGWSWDIEPDDKHPYLCHQCGHENTKGETDEGAGPYDAPAYQMKPDHVHFKHQYNEQNDNKGYLLQMGRKSIIVEQYGDEAELFKLASAYYRKNGKVMTIKVLEKILHTLSKRDEPHRAKLQEFPPSLNLQEQTSPEVREKVRRIQRGLISKGYNLGKTGADGFWGPLTNKAWNSYKSKKSAVTNKNPKPVVVNKKKPVVSNKKTTPCTYSPRIDAELTFIKERLPWWRKLLGANAEKPFFIYDPKYNLLFLFNSDFSLIKSTSVVDGKDAQQDAKPFHPEDWCKASNLDTQPHVCTNKGTKEKQFPSYASLNNIAVKFIPKGIYTINALTRNSGYSGVGKNLFSLADSSGKQMSAAIHGVPKIEGRLIASKKLESLLQSEKNNNKVPQEYLNAVDTIIASANMSYGCIGIPASFVEDPKVIEAVKVGVPVYVMGESNKGYLVQNSSNYFNKLNGDGESCTNPMMIAQSTGKQLPSQSGYENVV